MDTLKLPPGSTLVPKNTKIGLESSYKKCIAEDSIEESPFFGIDDNILENYVFKYDLLNKYTTHFSLLDFLDVVRQQRVRVYDAISSGVSEKGILDNVFAQLKKDKPDLFFERWKTGEDYICVIQISKSYSEKGLLLYDTYTILANKLQPRFSADGLSDLYYEEGQIGELNSSIQYVRQNYGPDFLRYKYGKIYYIVLEAGANELVGDDIKLTVFKVGKKTLASRKKLRNFIQQP